MLGESPSHRIDGGAGTTSWTGRKLPEPERETEEMGHSMRDGVWRTFNIGRRHGGGSGAGGIPARGGEMEDRTRMRRPTTADTLVADENIDRHSVSAGSHYSQEEGAIAAAPAPETATGGDTGDTTPAAVAVTGGSSAQAPRERRNKRRSSSLTRLPSRIGQNQQAPLGRDRRPLKITSTGPPDIVNLNSDTHYPVQFYDNDDSDAANTSNADNGIAEVPRGREGRLGMNKNTTRMPRTMSGSSLTLNPGLGMLRTSAGTTTPTGLSSSPTTPLQGSPYLPPATRSRPRTAPTSPTTSTTTISASTAPLASIPISRPATADSNSLIRHHRLDSILASSTAHLRQGHHRTPTRESSPSRSVRFIDYVDGESGYVGPSGPIRDSNGGGSNGSAGNGGRTVLAVEIPPPFPSIPRSYSFCKDKDGNGNGNGNGKTLVDSPVEEEGPLNAAASTISASRPLTR